MWKNTKNFVSKKTISIEEVSPKNILDPFKDFKDVNDQFFFTLHEKNNVYYPSKYFVDPKIKNGDYLASYMLTDFQDRPDYSLKTNSDCNFKLYIIEDMKPRQVKVKIPGATSYIEGIFIYHNILHVFYQEAVYSTVIGDQNYGKFSKLYYPTNYPKKPSNDNEENEDNEENYEEDYDRGIFTSNEYYLTIQDSTAYMIPRDINQELCVLTTYSFETREIINYIENPIKDIMDSTPKIYTNKNYIMIHDEYRYNDLFIYDQYGLNRLHHISLNEDGIHIQFGSIDSELLRYKINRYKGVAFLELYDDEVKEIICQYELKIDLQLNEGYINESFKGEFFIDGIFIDELKKYFKLTIHEDIYSMNKISNNDIYFNYN